MHKQDLCCDGQDMFREECKWISRLCPGRAESLVTTEAMALK